MLVESSECRALHFYSRATVAGPWLKALIKALIEAHTKAVINGRAAGPTMIQGKSRSSS